MSRWLRRALWRWAMREIVRFPLAIELRPVNDEIVIEGIRYSCVFFRRLGVAQAGDVLEVVENRDGLLSIKRLDEWVP